MSGKASDNFDEIIPQSSGSEISRGRKQSTDMNNNPSSFQSKNAHLTLEKILEERQKRQHVRTVFDDDSDDSDIEDFPDIAKRRPSAAVVTHRRGRSRSSSVSKPAITTHDKSQSPEFKNLKAGFDLDSDSDDDRKTRKKSLKSILKKGRSTPSLSDNVTEGQEKVAASSSVSKKNMPIGTSPLVNTTTAEDLETESPDSAKPQAKSDSDLTAQHLQSMESISEPGNVPTMNPYFNSMRSSSINVPYTRDSTYSHQTAMYQNMPPEYSYPDYSDDEDDTLSVIEEAVNDEDNSKLHEETYGWSSKTPRQLLVKWFWKFVKYSLMIIFFMTPGVACEFYKDRVPDLCYAFNTELMLFSKMISVSIFGIFLSDLAVMLAMVFIQRAPFLGIQFLYYITNISKPLKWTMVTLIIFISWNAIFYNTAVLSYETNGITFGKLMMQIFACIFVMALVFLIKAVAMRFAAIRFHRAAYYKRIKNALFCQYVLQKLIAVNPLKSNGASTLAGTVGKFMNGSAGKKKKSSSKKEDIDLEQGGENDEYQNYEHKMVDETAAESLPISEAEHLTKRKLSNHRLAVFVEYIKNHKLSYTEGVFKSAILRLHTREGILQSSDIVSDSFGGIELKISQANAAKLLSRYLFTKLSSWEMKEVLPSDFAKVLPPEMLTEGFCLFDGNWDGSLSEKEFYTTLLSVMRERKALRTALFDAESAIDRLDEAVTTTVWFCLLIVSFMLFGFDPQKVLLTVSSFLLAIAFAIGNSAKTLLESIIFIFVRHPFDIGDRIVVDKTVYTITRVSLLTTEVRRYDNAVLYFNNADLSAKPILNLRRSPDQFDLISMQVAFNTPHHVLRALETKLSDYLNKRSSHFYSRFEVEYKEVENSNRLLMRLWIQHRGNFQNMRKYRERRGKIILKLKRLSEQFNIEYDLPAQKVIHEGLGWEFSGSAPSNVGPAESVYGGGYASSIATSHQPNAEKMAAHVNRSISSEMGSGARRPPPFPAGRQQYHPHAAARAAAQNLPAFGSMMDDGYGGYGQPPSELPFDTGYQPPAERPEVPEGGFDDQIFSQPSPYTAYNAPLKFNTEVKQEKSTDKKPKKK